MSAYTDPFETALVALRQKAGRLKLDTIPLDVFNKTYRRLTIDKFLDLLYSLFKMEGLLNDEQDTLGPNSNDKFFYTEIYPDLPEGKNFSNTVTYEIYKRQPAEFDSKVIKEPGTTQYRPDYKCIVTDTDSRLAICYEKHYENYLKFTVFSEKAEDARKISSVLENFFTKYYHLLRMHVGHLVYEGRGQTIMTEAFGNKRVFGIPLLFRVRTDEPGFIKKDDIVSIDTYGHVVDSFFMDELNKINNFENKN